MDEGTQSTIAKWRGQRLMQRHSLARSAASAGRATWQSERRAVQRFSDKARCADSKVLTNNIVMVIGPTPPGTGVM